MHPSSLLRADIVLFAAVHGFACLHLQQMQSGELRHWLELWIMMHGHSVMFFFFFLIWTISAVAWWKLPYMYSGDWVAWWATTRPRPVRTSILLLTMFHNAASHAEGTDPTRVCASFLLIQLWRASVCKASERFSLQQWTSWMIVNQAFLCAALQNSRTMGKHSSETNSQTQKANTSKHILDRNNMCLQTPVLMTREIVMSFFGSKQDRLGLLFGIDGVVYSSELLSSTGSQRNLKGWVCSCRASNK